MDHFQLVLVLLMICAESTNTNDDQITQSRLANAFAYNITESDVTTLNGNLTLTMSIPYEKPPVDGKSQTSEQKCDRTCADCPGYKETHFGNTWTFTMKNATKKCITWKFAGGNLDAADFHLKINSLTNEYAYRITQSGIAVLDGNVTITITIPNMKRPVIWEHHDYTNEYDRTCVNDYYYIVTHIGNTSTVSVRKGTKDCPIWKFNDVNLNATDIHLKIEETKSLSLFGFSSWYFKLPIASSNNFKIMDIFCYLSTKIFGWTSTYAYKITHSYITMLNGNLNLTMSIPYEKPPEKEKLQTSERECDRTSADCPGYKETHFGNTWNLSIKNATKKCLTWKYDDANLNAADIHLKIEGLTNVYAYKITQNGIAVRKGNVTITTTIPNMKRPVVWEYHDYTNECDRTCVNGNYYIVKNIVKTLSVSVRKDNKDCSIWKFNDVNLNEADIHLKIEGGPLCIIEEPNHLLEHQRSETWTKYT